MGQAGVVPSVTTVHGETRGALRKLPGAARSMGCRWERGAPWAVLWGLWLRLYLFRERGREGEREGEKHPCVVASCTPPMGDLACNPGMSPDGIEPATLGFAGPHSVHWATPAGALWRVLKRENHSSSWKGHCNGSRVSRDLEAAGGGFKPQASFSLGLEEVLRYP